MRFGMGLRATTYLLQRYLWQRERDKRRTQRHTQQQSWRVVRAAAAQSRRKQQSKPPPPPTPKPPPTKVQRLDLPDKATEIYHNSGYGKFPPETLVPQTISPLTNPDHRPTLEPLRRGREEAPR